MPIPIQCKKWSLIVWAKIWSVDRLFPRNTLIFSTGFYFAHYDKTGRLRPGLQWDPAEDGCGWRWGHLFQAFLELDPVSSLLTARPPQRAGEVLLWLHPPVKSKLSAQHISTTFSTMFNNKHLTFLTRFWQNTKYSTKKPHFWLKHSFFIM